MFWLGIGLVVAALLLWMWTIDRKRRGATRDLGWDGRGPGTPLTGGDPETSGIQLSQHAFEIDNRLTERRNEPRSPRRAETPPRRRPWRREPGRSSEDR